MGVVPARGRSRTVPFEVPLPRALRNSARRAPARSRFVGAVVLLAAAWVGVFPTSAARAEYDVFDICTHPAWQLSPTTNGRVVVWADLRNCDGPGYAPPGTPCGDIYGQDLVTGETWALSLDPAHESGSGIDGDTVVWERDGDIIGYDLQSRGEFVIAGGAHQEELPDISGDIVVWHDDRDNYPTLTDIYAKNLATDTTFPVYVGSGTQRYARINDNTVAWEDHRSDTADIYANDLSTGQTFAVCTDASEQLRPDVGGDWIVWTDSDNANVNAPGADQDIRGYNMVTGELLDIAVGEGLARWARTDGKTVVWRDDRHGHTDIFGFDLETREEFEISVHPDWATWAYVHENLVVWRDVNSANGRYDIVGAYVPEPMTLTVLAGGAWLLVARRRRRT